MITTHQQEGLPQWWQKTLSITTTHRATCKQLALRQKGGCIVKTFTIVYSSVYIVYGVVIQRQELERERERAPHRETQIVPNTQLQMKLDLSSSTHTPFEQYARSSSTACFNGWPYIWFVMSVPRVFQFFLLFKCKFYLDFTLIELQHQLYTLHPSCTPTVRLLVRSKPNLCAGFYLALLQSSILCERMFTLSLLQGPWLHSFVTISATDVCACVCILFVQAC